jgi:hypothetical protein
MSFAAPVEYEVEFCPYTERHFVKTFSKKYKGAWDMTREALTREFKSFEVLIEKSIAETVVDAGDVRICKTEFKVTGSYESRKTSGNRCIVAVHKGTRNVYVLLVYAKTDVRGSNETAWWKAQVRDNYVQYRAVL